MKLFKKKEQEDKARREAEVAASRRKASQMTIDYMLFGNQTNLKNGAKVFNKTEWRDQYINSLQDLELDQEYQTEQGNILVRRGDDNCYINGIHLAVAYDIEEEGDDFVGHGPRRASGAPKSSKQDDDEELLIDLGLPSAEEFQRSINQDVSTPTREKKGGRGQDLMSGFKNSHKKGIQAEDYFHNSGDRESLVDHGPSKSGSKKKDKKGDIDEDYRAPTIPHAKFEMKGGQKKDEKRNSKMSEKLVKENRPDERKEASKLTLDFLLFSDENNLKQGVKVFDMSTQGHITIHTLAELEMWHKYESEQGNILERTGASEVKLNGIPIKQDSDTKLKVPEKMNLQIEFFSAAGHGDDEKVKELVLKHDVNVKATDSCGHTALHWAALNNRVQIAIFLAQNGADVEARSKEGHTPLHWAALRGYIDMAEALIENGADPNGKDNYGYSPLIHATQYGMVRMGKWLIDKGCRFDPDDLGHTPMHWAAYQGFDEMARFIYYNGGEECLESKDKDGCTPLHRAASMGKTDVCRQLLSQGASTLAKDNRGSTAAVLAKRNGHHRLAEMLEE